MSLSNNSGEYSGYARQQWITERYVARVIKGSLLAPDIIQRILEGRQPVTLTVQKLKKPFARGEVVDGLVGQCIPAISLPTLPPTRR